MKCRVCSNEMTFYEQVHNCRAEGGDSLLKVHPYICKKSDITLYKCLYCSHIQSDNLLTENYYEEYSDDFGKKQYFGELDNRETKIKLLREMADEGESIIEIGCGGGYDLKIAQPYFKRCFGVEPSEKECNIARKAGIEVINSYFNSGLNLHSKVSAFMMFQVMEHIDDIYEILRYAYEILEDKGVGLINVPNGQQIMDEGDLSQIILEHIHYYTPFSLAYAANKMGFHIERILPDKKAKEIDVYIRKNEMIRSFNQCFCEGKETLKNCTRGSASLAIYGAGAKAHIYSEMIEKDKVKHVFDSDESKVGKYISGIDIPVEEISKEKLNSCDAVVIFASSYNQEIINKLLVEYRYEGEIVYKSKDIFRRYKDN